MTKIAKPVPLASRPYRRAAYILAAACFVMLAVIFGHPYFTNASRPARGMGDPIIALQMARDLRDVDAILADVPSPDREVMRLKQYADFGFIAGYTLLALTLGEILSKRTKLGRALALAAVFAAAFDAREDILILRIAATPLESTSQAMIDALRLSSIVKWALTAITVAILAYCWMKIPRWFTRAIAGMEFAGAALAVGGIAVNTLLPWSAALMAFGILLNAATLKFLTHEPATADPVSRPL